MYRVTEPQWGSATARQPKLVPAGYSALTVLGGPNASRKIGLLWELCGMHGQVHWPGALAMPMYSNGD